MYRFVENTEKPYTLLRFLAENYQLIDGKTELSLVKSSLPKFWQF